MDLERLLVKAERFALYSFKDLQLVSTACTTRGCTYVTHRRDAETTRLLYSRSTHRKQSSPTRGAIPRAHTVFLYLNAPELVWLNLSGAGTLKICRCVLCKALQAKVGSPFERWLFSISIITSNILWRDMKQRPTRITDARKERFLPSRCSPSLPVTPSSCTFRKGGNTTGRCQVGSSREADSGAIFNVPPVYERTIYVTSI